MTNQEFLDKNENPDIPPSPTAADEQADAEDELADGELPGEQASDKVSADGQTSNEQTQPQTAADEPVDLGIVEALLFATHHPLTPGQLAELIGLESTRPVRQAVKLLNEQYEQQARAFRIEQVAGGYQLLTLPQYGDYLQKLHHRESDNKLGKAALETLAIIAYKQPVLRVDIEAIRGVACGEMIRSLMEKRLVKIAGRAEEPGRPILYGTTKRFLEQFGLNSPKDLPLKDPKQPQA